MASSPTLLANPDIEAGPATAQPEPYSAGPPLVNAYTFTSTKATAAPGTIYWDASFSTASLVQCEGLTPHTDATTARMLTVLPAPPPISLPAPVLVTSPPAVAPTVHVSISVPDHFDLAHPTVRYRILCTTSCSGDTYYHVVLGRRHAKDVRAPKLDASPKPVSITTPAGGDQQVTHAYTSGTLRMLKRIIRSGEVVEIQIGVKVTGPAGKVARAQRTARL